MREQSLRLLFHGRLELVCVAVFRLDGLLLQGSLRLEKELPVRRIGIALFFFSIFAFIASGKTYWLCRRATSSSDSSLSASDRMTAWRLLLRALLFFGLVDGEWPLSTRIGWASNKIGYCELVRQRT